MTDRQRTHGPGCWGWGPFVAKIGTERPTGGVDRHGQEGRMCIPTKETGHE